MLVEIPQTVQGVPERQRGWGMLVEIPQTVQGVPERPRGWGMLVAEAVGAGVVFRPHQHPPAALRLRYALLSPFEGGIPDVSALPDLIVKEHQSA